MHFHVCAEQPETEMIVRPLTESVQKLIFSVETNGIQKVFSIYVNTLLHKCFLCYFLYELKRIIIIRFFHKITINELLKAFPTHTHTSTNTFNTICKDFRNC